MVAPFLLHFDQTCAKVLFQAHRQFTTAGSDVRYTSGIYLVFIQTTANLADAFVGGVYRQTLPWFDDVGAWLRNRLTKQ